MSFPQAVADEVLVKCGRHCALCHKFCGLKIELHHIKQQKDEGPDTADNCIPLCFECHADMRSYDHKHPKGRKYSAAELISHRDDWYKKFAAGGGAAASPDHLELDRATFRRLRQRLPYENGVMQYLNHRYVAQPYPRGGLDPLHDFLELDCRDPGFEFLDPDLEAARAKLEQAVHSYTNDVLTHTFAVVERQESAFYPEGKERNPEFYYKVVYETARKEGIVNDAYAEMVKLARRKLGIDG